METACIEPWIDIEEDANWRNITNTAQAASFEEDKTDRGFLEYILNVVLSIMKL